VAYLIVLFLMTSNDLEGHSPAAGLLHASRRTIEQQFTKFQLARASRGPSAIAELVVVSRYTSETLTMNVAELNARVKTITSRIEQAADVQLQREFHGFLEVSAVT